VFEVGCGDGRFTFLYADDTAYVLGVDPDRDEIPRGAPLAYALGVRTLYVGSSSRDLRLQVDFPTQYVAAVAEIDDQIALVGTAGGGSFAGQLTDAKNYLIDGATRASCNTLSAYIHHAQAQSGKQLPTTLADTLIANANQIRAVIGC
jgi:hypothetical protein